jgi:hypothetical protein
MEGLAGVTAMESKTFCVACCAAPLVKLTSLMAYPSFVLLDVYVGWNVPAETAE